jgi:hypothetical protein
MERSFKETWTNTRMKNVKIVPIPVSIAIHVGHIDLSIGKGKVGDPITMNATTTHLIVPTNVVQRISSGKICRSIVTNVF